MIGLIDFDGTVIFNTPEGPPCPIDTGAERVLKKLIEKGHHLVLWTCRNKSEDNPYNYVDGVRKKVDSLDEAINWFKSRNIPLYSVNCLDNGLKYVGTSRKPLCDFIIDDLNVGTPLIYKDVPFISRDGNTYISKSHCVDWEKMEKLLKDRNIL